VSPVSRALRERLMTARLTNLNDGLFPKKGTFNGRPSLIDGREQRLLPAVDLSQPKKPPRYHDRPSDLGRDREHGRHLHPAPATIGPTPRATGCRSTISRSEGGTDYCVIELARRVGERGHDVLGLKEVVVRQDLFPGRPRRDQFEDVRHPDAVSTDTRAAAALACFHGDTAQKFHLARWV